jgi:hypothetical protein
MVNFLSKMEANIVGMNNCNVCNIVVKTASKHIENQKHLKAINNSIISNANFNRKTECLICYREFQNLKRHKQTNARRESLNDRIIASSFFNCNWCNYEVNVIGVHED